MASIIRGEVRWIRRPWGLWHGFYRWPGTGYRTSRTAVIAQPDDGGRWLLCPHQYRTDTRGTVFSAVGFGNLEELFEEAPKIIVRKYCLMGAWPSGPWDSEPDRIEWIHKSGAPLLMTRNCQGAWCGYVGLLPGHPNYGYGVGDLDAAVHGGITYAGGDHSRFYHPEARGRDVWWVGFDCTHGFDLAPRGLSWPGLPEVPHVMYRDQHYVRAQVEQLADQLLAKETLH